MAGRRHAMLARLALVAAVVAALAAAAVGLATGLSVAPDATDRLRDDAFYEFAWAANVASGRGPTVSDGTTTSGVQLLWSLLLVPVAWLGGPAALPVVAPWLGLLLHVAAAALLLRASRDRVAASCVALCWLGNPLLVRECQNGQETALACLMLVVLWQCRAASDRRFFAVLLLATLARIDLFAIGALLSRWRHPERPWRAVRSPLAVLAVLAACNLSLGGGWLPDSGAPMTWLWRANFAATNPDAWTWLAQSWWYLRPALLGAPYATASAMGFGVAVFSLVRPCWPAKWRAVPLVAIGIAAVTGRVHDLLTVAWAALLLALLPARRARPVPKALLALFAGAAAIVVLHWVVRWYPRDYYLAPLVVVGSIAVLRLAKVRLLLLAFALAQLADLGRVRPEPLGGQQEMEMGGRFLADVLPAGERVGCFNSGLVTFHASVLAAGTDRFRGVVNLDGVVDARALRALQQQQLSTWLDRQRIRFVLDNPVQFRDDPTVPHACGRWFDGDFLAERDLVEMARFDVPGVDNGRPGGDSFRLYWRRGRGEPLPAPAQAKELGSGHGGRYVLWPAQAGQSLDVEQAPGAFVPLATADVATTVVVFVAAEALGTGRLFVRGEPTPILVLVP